jgi:hypothetical protein|tara:strand:+ start:217 stop:318 length:102 start_codon:yes stop_codon:yes gene_type:complete
MKIISDLLEETLKHRRHAVFVNIAMHTVIMMSV